MRLGRQRGTSALHIDFDGIISNALFWNSTALDADDILALHNASGV
jgi:hypothetical protein